MDSIKIGRRAFMLEVRTFADDAVVKTLGPFTERTIAGLRAAMDRSLDHDQFYVSTRQATAAEIAADPSPSRTRNWWA